MNKKLLLIINPNAGKGNIKKKLPIITQNFEKIGYKINLIYTKINYSPKQILQEHGTDVDLLVCCGGDGTLNESINAIIDLNLHLKISFIPLGTMNDFAKTIGVLAKNIYSFNNYENIYSDVGKFNEKYFNYVAAFGAFTKVSYSTPQSFKKILGKFAYFLVAIKHLLKIRSYKIKVRFDDEEIEDKFIYGAISNSKSVAGIEWFNKTGVKLDDGKFEMILIKKPKNILQVIKIGLSVLTKKYDEKCFIYSQVKNVEFQTEEKLEWTLDRRNWRCT